MLYKNPTFFSKLFKTTVLLKTSKLNLFFCSTGLIQFLLLLSILKKKKEVEGEKAFGELSKVSANSSHEECRKSKVHRLTVSNTLPLRGDGLVTSQASGI